MLQSPVSVVTEYVVVQPQTTLVDSIAFTAVASLRKEVALQAQGESVELFDGMPPLTTASSFATVYDIADEAVFRLNNGQLILLFDHQLKENLRPKEVNEIIWKEILKVKNKGVVVQDVLMPTPEEDVDLVDLWNRARESDEIIPRTKIFIKLITEILEPASTVCLRGQIPNLPLLSAIYLARPYGHTVVFEDTQGRSVTLFSNL